MEFVEATGYGRITFKDEAVLNLLNTLFTGMASVHCINMRENEWVGTIGLRQWEELKKHLEIIGASFEEIWMIHDGWA